MVGTSLRENAKQNVPYCLGVDDMRIRKNLGKCTRCGREVVWERDINLLLLRGILKPKWKPPRWCSGCQIDSAEEAREAKASWYGAR